MRPEHGHDSYYGSRLLKFQISWSSASSQEQSDGYPGLRLTPLVEGDHCFMPACRTV